MDNLLILILFVIIFLVVFFEIRSTVRKNRSELFIQGAEKAIMESSGMIFKRIVSNTEQDVRAGFLPKTGESWFIGIRHIPKDNTTHRGVWIVSNGNALKTFFLSYDRDARWILDLGNDITKFRDRVDDIAQVGKQKFVRYRDGSVGIWRDVYGDGDLFW